MVLKTKIDVSIDSNKLRPAIGDIEKFKTAILTAKESELNDALAFLVTVFDDAKSDGFAPDYRAHCIGCGFAHDGVIWHKTLYGRIYIKMAQALVERGIVLKEDTYLFRQMQTDEAKSLFE